MNPLLHQQMCLQLKLYRQELKLRQLKFPLKLIHNLNLKRIITGQSWTVSFLFNKAILLLPPIRLLFPSIESIILKHVHY